MATQRSNSMTKGGENAPAYDEGQSAAPPAYSSLPEAVAAEMNSLRVGDPNETINVPMILSSEQKRKRDYFLPTSKSVVKQTVIVRKMTREHYLKHYAKDIEGNYVGTDKPAVDAGLVFVMGKSSNEDILEQVRKVAFGKQHHSDDFGVEGGVGMGAAGAGGGSGGC